MTELVQLQQQFGTQPQAVVGRYPLGYGSGSSGASPGNQPAQRLRYQPAGGEEEDADDVISLRKKNALSRNYEYVSKHAAK